MQNWRNGDSSSRSPLTSATSHAAACSACALSRSKDYCAARAARRLRAELSIAGWHASCAYASIEV